jgi:hypothetical protein
VVVVLIGKDSLYLQLLRCLVSRDKSLVARFCSVMVEIVSHLGSYGPGSDRTGGSLCYRHVQHTKNLNFIIY